MLFWKGKKKNQRMHMGACVENFWIPRNDYFSNSPVPLSRIEQESCRAYTILILLDDVLVTSSLFMINREGLRCSGHVWGFISLKFMPKLVTWLATS